MVSFVSKMTVATVIMLISILSVVHCQDTRLISGPHCQKSSDNKSYNDNVGTLLHLLVNDTKKVRRSGHQDFSYNHNYPNKDVGSVIGGAICDGHLWGWQCESCLRTARKKIQKGCKPSIEGSVYLEDCSIWFKKIVA